MATKNRRVATYLPPEIDESFKAFKIRSGLATEEDPNQNDSQALIQILSEFLGVSREVAYSLPPDLVSRLAVLEEKVAHLSESIDQRFENLKIEIDSAQQSTTEVKDELLGELNSRLSVPEIVHPGQLDLLTQDEFETQEGNDILSGSNSEPSEHVTVGPMSGPQLTARFRMSNNAASKMRYQYRNNPKKFERWSQTKDPEGLAWEFRNRKFWPKSDSFGES